MVGDLDDLVPGDPLPFVDPDHCDEEQVAEAALDALAIMTKETAKLRDVEIELHGVIEDLMGQLDRFHATRTYKAKERLVAMSRDQRRRAGRAVGLPPVAGQELAVDVAADLPGREPVGARARPVPRRPAPGGPTVEAIRLPAIRVIISAATSLAITTSRWGSCTGAVASAIGVPGSFFFLIMREHPLLAEQAGQDRVADALVRRGRSRAGAAIAGHHPALDQRQPGDVGGHRDRHRRPGRRCW